MRLLNIALRRETLAPVLALSFASGCCVLMVTARVAWTANYRYIALVWNLLLAWIPLVLALLAEEKFQAGAGRDWRFGGLAAVWLLFFPNAPYIFTDLIHLNGYFAAHFWVDLTLILCCALTGFVSGFVSLFLMQGMVRKTFGSPASWLFIAGVAVLSSFGVCLGRFMRFNSWDVLFKPMTLCHHLGGWIADPFAQKFSLAFAAIFAAFTFIAYLMLYALTHLQHSQPSVAAAAVAPLGRPFDVLPS